MAIIGSNGVLGSDLTKYFSRKYIVTAINRNNYRAIVGSSFDIVINANGNSKRFWANENPVEDFVASTDSVIRSIFNFPCELYIYISSPDVYSNHTEPRYTKESNQINSDELDAYGLHKYLSELIVKKYKKRFLILRSSMILGTNLRKGPIYDAINGKDLLVTPSSRLQLITTFAIAEVIDVLLKKSVKNEVINIGGVGTFSFTKLEEIIKRKTQIMPEAKLQKYEMSTAKLQHLYPSLKSSQQYLQDFITDYLKH